MQDADTKFDPDLANLSQDKWRARLRAASDDNGFFETLGKKHFAGMCGAATR